MPLVYALVAQSTFSGAAEIVAECQTGRGDFGTIVEVILEKTSNNQKKSYFHEGYSFNFIIEDGTTYLCVADVDFPTRVCFAFLQKIMEEYDARPDFDRRMAVWLDRYSTDPSLDKVRQVESQIDGVKDVMMENLQGLLQRGDKLEDVAEHTEDMIADATSFQRGSHAVKRHFVMKNMKLIIVIVLVFICALITALFILVVLMIFVVCGAFKACTDQVTNPG